MTTEIAVLNRLGVALATDSAVTISSGGRTKVFNTGDKLFELSSIHPVAVMINGNMDFLGIPWEIIVKDFRARSGADPRPSLEEWMKDFLRFVEDYDGISNLDTEYHLAYIIDSNLTDIRRRVIEEINGQLLYQDQSTNRRSKFDLGKLFLDAIKNEYRQLEKVPIADGLRDISVDDVAKIHDDLFTRRAREIFAPLELSDAELAAIKGVLAKALLRTIPSDSTTGIVMAGYGKNDRFPAILAVEVDGSELGKLKLSYRQRESISDAEDGGRVISFAQTDVIERLLGGADRHFIEKTAEFIERAVAQVAEAIERTVRSKRPGKKSKALWAESVVKIVDLIANQYRTDTAKTLQKAFAQEFDRMIATMPKIELIELAEALVSIIAAGRKTTVDEGTVGGPIDVAFITKHDGFVWIKRKHYFERELNPRYFWRKYRVNLAGEEPC